MRDHLSLTGLYPRKDCHWGPLMPGELVKPQTGSAGRVWGATQNQQPWVENDGPLLSKGTWNLRRKPRTLLATQINPANPENQWNHKCQTHKSSDSDFSWPLCEQDMERSFSSWEWALRVVSWNSKGLGLQPDTWHFSSYHFYSKNIRVASMCWALFYTLGTDQWT